MFGSIGLPELLVVLVVGAFVLYWIFKRLRKGFREGLAGVPDQTKPVRPKKHFGLPLLGFLGGGLVGFLLRPAVPLIGQLPFGVVLTRGDDLRGLDLLVKPTAETSFNYMVVGVIIGLAVGIALNRMRRPSLEPQAAAAASVAAPATPSAAKFCLQCGSPLLVGASFCSSCGRKL